MAGNSIEPAGNANIGNFQSLVTTDSTVGQITDLLDIPLRTGSGPSVYLRDVGTVSDSSDIPAGYALLNDKRTVYIPVTKRPDASTITVVNEVRASLSRFQSLVPEDIKITYEFDQSQYVRDALLSVLREGSIGRDSHGPYAAFLFARLAQFIGRRHHDPIRSAYSGGGSVGHGTNH